MTTARTLIGSLRLVHGKAAVRMEDRFETDATDLWSALTDPGRLARWIAKVEGDLHVGGSFDAVFTSGWEGSGRVEVCDPPSRLLVTLSPGHEDETVIEAQLLPESGATRLVIEERGLPLGEAAAHGGGWQAHLEDLADYLAGRPPRDWRSRWLELSPTYEDRQAQLQRTLKTEGAIPPN
ncbi:MAG: SRPBCC family protein [Candidatus Limnocylindrales bacterium]